MWAIVKAVLAVAGAGTGIAVPVVVNKISNSVTSVAEGASSVIKTVNQKVTEKRENAKISQALKVSSDKNCKLFRNTANFNDWFGALYACKEAGDKDVFYYLSNRDDVKSHGSSSWKKIKTVSYEKGQGETDVLSLVLEGGGETIKWNIASQGEGGWAHFKDVNLSDSCKVKTQESGGDVLSCQLKDSSRADATFSYSFSIF